MSTPLSSLDKKKFGALVRSLREARGLTQAQLADMVGMKRPGITNLEVGFAKPSVDAFLAIGVALDVSLDCLAGLGAGDSGERAVPHWVDGLMDDLRTLPPAGREAVRVLVKGYAGKG